MWKVLGTNYFCGSFSLGGKWKLWVTVWVCLWEASLSLGEKRTGALFPQGNPRGIPQPSPGWRNCNRCGLLWVVSECEHKKAGWRRLNSSKENWTPRAAEAPALEGIRFLPEEVGWSRQSWPDWKWQLMRLLQSLPADGHFPFRWTECCGNSCSQREMAWASRSSRQPKFYLPSAHLYDSCFVRRVKGLSSPLVAGCGHSGSQVGSQAGHRIKSHPFLLHNSAQLFRGDELKQESLWKPLSRRAAFRE